MGGAKRSLAANFSTIATFLSFLRFCRFQHPFRFRSFVHLFPGPALKRTLDAPRFVRKWQGLNFPDQPVGRGAIRIQPCSVPANENTACADPESRCRSKLLDENRGDENHPISGYFFPPGFVPPRGNMHGLVRERRVGGSIPGFCRQFNFS